jgi:hypothetical protein
MTEPKHAELDRTPRACDKIDRANEILEELPLSGEGGEPLRDLGTDGSFLIEEQLRRLNKARSLLRYAYDDDLDQWEMELIQSELQGTEDDE